MEEVDDFLAHYGVTGMKWGVRKGSIKSRLQGAASDSTERRLISNKAIATNTAQTRDYRRAVLKGGSYGLGMRKKAAASKVETLEARKKRIDAGKTTTWDKIDIAFNTHPADLLVSRRDKRAIPGSAPDKVNKGRQKAAKMIAGVAGAAVITTLNNKQNRAVAVELLKMGANSIILAKQKSNANKQAATRRSDTHGIANYSTVRLSPNSNGVWE